MFHFQPIRAQILYMKNQSEKPPILCTFVPREKRDCRTKLIEMYLALQPMTPVLARYTLKQYVTSQNFEPVYTIHMVDTEGVRTTVGKDVFNSPRKKSVSRSHKLNSCGKDSQYYKYNDDFTAAYCVMNDFARKHGMTLTAATVTFSDEVCLSAKVHNRGIVACIGERIKGNSRRQMFLFAVEECKSAQPVIDALGNCSMRLHAHLLTLTSNQENEKVEDLRSRLKVLSRVGVKSDVEVTTTYIASLPYSDSIRLDEAFHGELPTNESDSYFDAERKGVWKGCKSGREVVLRRLPLDQRWVDYMSKDIDKVPSNKAQTKTFGMMNGLGRDVAKYRELKYYEGLAFRNIDFNILDDLITGIQTKGDELDLSKVLEKYYKSVS